MVLLILPVLWAAVLLPYWVRFVRERRAERSVAAFPGRGSLRQRRAAVRYVFGAYDPYRDEHLLRNVDSLEKDVSYLPPVYRPRRPAWQDTYLHRSYDDSYFDDQDDHTLYGDTHADEMAADGYADHYTDVRDTPAVVRGRRVATAPPVTPLPVRRAPGAPHAAVGNGPVRVVPNGNRRITSALTASSRRALRRRRQIFFGLVLGFLASLSAALWFGSIAVWGVHAGALMLLAGYVSLLVRHHQRVVDRTAKVRRLTPAAGTGPSRPAVVVLSGGSAR